MQYEMWTYGVAVDDVDLTGFKVEAVDGGIGQVDEATYETGASYLVVDTGPWIFGKKVVLPARSVNRVDLDDQRVWIDRTKDEIKNAPEFSPDTYRDPAYRARLEQYYQPYYQRSA